MPNGNVVHLRSWVMDEKWGTGIIQYLFRCSVCYCQGPELARQHTQSYVQYLADHHPDGRHYFLDDDYFVFRKERIFHAGRMFVCDYRAFITVLPAEALLGEFIHLTPVQAASFSGIRSMLIQRRTFERRTTGDKDWNLSGWVCTDFVPEKT